MVDFNVYKTSVVKIRHFACENGISETDVNEVFKNCFCLLNKQKKKCLLRHIRFTVVMLFVSIVCVASLHHKMFTATILRNLQNSIYPGLKMLRKIATPIIEQYPSLSEFYDEWCLFENPYFYVSDMDCWPCSIVPSVSDLIGHHVSRSFNLGIPYTKSENLSDVHFKDLQRLLLDNKEIFELDAAIMYSNNSTYRHAGDIMKSKMDIHPSEKCGDHITWRINCMKSGRILRKLFPKPVDVPDWWEQSTEKFIFLDETKSSHYSLPNPECSNVVVRCTAGARLIKMMASPECSGSCETSTILLSSGNTLWYNWWYWRPVSLPVQNSTGVSINYMTSFC